MLNLMVNGLRAGYSTMQAMEGISRELPAPISDGYAQIAEYERTKPTEWRKAIGRKCNLKLRYNLTPQEYETKLASQDYKCALCGKDANDNIRRGKVEPLCVDHCHTTHKLRDLLCFHCNSFLGHAKDNPEVLTKAAQYLIDHQQK